MTKYEIISLIIQGIIAIGAIVFGLWQIFINRRLKLLQDYVAIAIVPGEGGTIKLVNTGRINLYLYAFEIDEQMKKLERERLISSASYESAYYWIPTNFVPRESKEFPIKLYITDEFGKKYITEGGGSSEKIDNEKSKVVVWTHRTRISDWKF